MAAHRRCSSAALYAVRNAAKLIDWPAMSCTEVILTSRTQFAVSGAIEPNDQYSLIEPERWKAKEIKDLERLRGIYSLFAADTKRITVRLTVCRAQLSGPKLAGSSPLNTVSRAAVGESLDARTPVAP